jgi:hypothetical protein
MAYSQKGDYMPWTDKQVRLFAAAAHNPAISKKVGIPQGKAREMEMEAGPKQRSHAMKLASALSGGQHGSR